MLNFCRVLLVLIALPVGAQNLDTVRIPGTEVSFTLASLPGGTFAMGEEGTSVTLAPFAIGTHEVTHDAYRIFQQRDNDSPAAATPDFAVDAVTRPSPPYLDFTYGMGTRGGFPQVNTTQQAALRYCAWLYQKTGQFFRLPTEAEWEYACLAGGDAPSPEMLGDYAWTYENSDEVFHPVGQKKPNAWGLYDLLGNVSEWTLDAYAADYFVRIGAWPQDPVIPPTGKHSRTVRGGHYDAEAAEVGCRVREKSQAKWQARDPQIPKSKWWNVDSPFVGFRLVRPAAQPSEEEIQDFFATFIVD
ncbi:SUMF1/EgtB/PvdO family nonheme iron enzyme [Neolewinella lacunae]|uniref:SUMF1/EgtB/PvdO family nonheme iron enzyme n=1 Tax=Neolewinella lacunae TaxID=1517758 RepID=A0A923TF93_9BACT|nr:SUMF1/EgtB/PvdO family nonheme iron enzyme [Neolewinella lacunae]MBC6996747.1 SUMF1/EgtB/PvdO family nonheme iron enzyme [Neolewinella lacunae]MDN3633388.1 SUMF1/EgtB/PvdO family nonheme iron enzyme [Neolewinella lacunae]